MNFPGWLLALYLVKGGDFVTTEIGLDRGLIELNPIAGHVAVRVGLMAAAPLAVELSARKLKRNGHARWALALRVAAIAAWGYATAHNLREIRSRAP